MTTQPAHDALLALVDTAVKYRAAWYSDVAVNTAAMLDDVSNAALALHDADPTGSIIREALADGLAPDLTFARFSAVNRERCEASDGFGHPLSGWSLSDWFVAAMGEFGEAANKVKKLNRVRDGIPGNRQTEEELRAGLADEIADAVIYLDLAAQALGFDLGTIVASKFDRTSEGIGAPHRLARAALEQP